jgi:predicted NAD-dependent protein-ADP-ribosyltransferase YbiA (DUF1768 family)
VESLLVHAAHTVSHTEGIDKHRPDWDDAKYGVLLSILRAKFAQHSDLAAKLVRPDRLKHKLDSLTVDARND